MSEWRNRGACRDENPDWWFPERTQGPKGGDKAKAICEACPVKAECLASAIENDEDYGIWGGTTPAERRRMTQ